MHLKEYAASTMRRCMAPISTVKQSKPPVGFEPMTSRLLSGCSTNSAKEADALCQIPDPHSPLRAMRTPVPGAGREALNQAVILQESALSSCLGQ